MSSMRVTAALFRCSSIRCSCPSHCLAAAASTIGTGSCAAGRAVNESVQSATKLAIDASVLVREPWRLPCGILRIIDHTTRGLELLTSRHLAFDGVPAFGQRLSDPVAYIALQLDTVLGRRPARSTRALQFLAQVLQEVRVFR